MLELALMLAPPLQNNWCFFERSYTWKICKGQLPLCTYSCRSECRWMHQFALFWLTSFANA